MRFFRLYDDGRNHVLLRLVEEDGKIRGPNNAVMFQRYDNELTMLNYCRDFNVFNGFKYISQRYGMVEIQ